jgi:hypothetical protein
VIMKHTKIIFLMMTFLVSLISGSSAHAKASEKESVLQLCNQYFGAPVDAKQNLFDVNQFYVLHVKFNNRGELVESAVEPKYFFEESHPEWNEPDNFAFLSKAEYESVLAHLDRIKPKGRFIKPRSNIVVVTNLTAPHKDIYEHAVLEWGEIVDLRRGDNAALEVRYFRLSYLKSRSGGRA